MYLPEQSWGKIPEFLGLKDKNEGKWWVPGEETNDEFTDYVNEWMGHWVGYVEETVFDVNVLVINEQNVVVNNYNKEVFEAFDRHGITPHIIKLLSVLSMQLNHSCLMQLNSIVFLTLLVS